MTQKLHVEWAIDIEVDRADHVSAAVAAAGEAWKSMRRDDSIANVFEVADENDMTIQVDLTTGEVGQRAWVPGIEKIAELAEWMHQDGWSFDEIVEMIRRPHKYADEYSKMIADRAFDAVAHGPEVEDTDGITTV